MKKSAAPLFPLFLLTLLAGGTFWLDRTSRFETAAHDGKQRHDPDFIVEHFETRRFSPEGRLQHTLDASIMRHYPDDDTTEIGTPSLMYYARTPPTHLEARRAWVSKDGKEVRLLDHVRMTRPASKDQPELTATSNELRVFPDDEIARTQTPVTLVNGLTTLQGNGLEANNRNQSFILTGQVRGLMNRPASRIKK